jgi:hypothetical protein
LCWWWRKKPRFAEPVSAIRFEPAPVTLWLPSSPARTTEIDDLARKLGITK